MTETDTPSWETYGNWAEGKPLTAGPWFLGLYQPSPESAAFWDAVREHRLVLRFCPSCNTFHHPRRIACTRCGSSVLEWRPARGAGTLFSFSEVHRAVSPVAGKPPYLIGIVRLEEGVSLLSRILTEDGGPVRIGQPVDIAFRRFEAGYDLPVFVVRSEHGRAS